MNSFSDFMNPPEENTNTKELLNVGEKLKLLRNQNDLSASKACEKLNEEYGLDISVNSMNSYESDRRLPNTQLFFALCEMYKCDDISAVFGVGEKARKKPQISLDDYGTDSIVEVLLNHYGKERSVEIIQKMIAKVTK